MKIKAIVCLLALLAIAATNVVENRLELPAAKVTVRVVGENGQPLVNADVSLGFGEMAAEGMTDASGFFTGEGRCGITGIGSTIKKAGYYMGYAPIPRFTERDNVANRWKPWNETYTAILRPIGKPVALYAKIVRTQIPAFDQPCGYDLEAGDWVPPYGKGMKKDFIFTIHQEWRGNYDYDVRGELAFKNPLDGLLETSIPDVGKDSEFRWERQAPEKGYEPKFQLQNTWYPSGSGKKSVRSFKSQDVWQGYFFRVRTMEQDGQIVNAHYGKIRGGIAIYPNDPKAKVVFTYYFNPTPNDMNLEWDTKKNLFGGLTDMETPREP